MFSGRARNFQPEARSPNLDPGDLHGAEGEVWNMEERPAKGHQEDTMGTMGGCER